MATITDESPEQTENIFTIKTAPDVYETFSSKDFTSSRIVTLTHKM